MGNKHMWLSWLFGLAVLLAGSWLGPVSTARETVQDPEPLMLAALEESGAEVREIELRTKAEMGIYSKKELENLAFEWAKRITGSSEGLATSGRGKIQIYQMVTKVRGIQLDFQLAGVPVNERYHTYLVVSIKGTRQQIQHIEQAKKQVSTALREGGANPQFSTCIRGIYSDKLSVDRQESRILSIFRTLRGAEVERLADETVVSISGYTEAWKPYIQVNGKRMNLQVATHRDTISGGTWITVGTPIITAEY